jgi:prepilin-type N-terminal cleavage/methylation domain-containing protein
MRQTHPAICKPRFQAGFTLLEISIVLVIAALIVGMGAVMVSSLFNDHTIQKAVTNIEVLGVEGVRRASTYHRQQAILFYEDRCELWDETGELVRTVPLPGYYKLFIHRYYSKDFEESAGQILRIRPGCLCEPIQLMLKNGGDEFQFALDPLTGGYNPDL